MFQLHWRLHWLLNMSLRASVHFDVGLLVHTMHRWENNWNGHTDARVYAQTLFPSTHEWAQKYKFAAAFRRPVYLFSPSAGHVVQQTRAFELWSEMRCAPTHARSVTHAQRIHAVKSWFTSTLFLPTYHHAITHNKPKRGTRRFSQLTFVVFHFSPWGLPLPICRIFFFLKR